MMKKARYICLEGTEGVGKTTQTAKLITTLESRGYRVLATKEPGTAHVPLTMMLRSIMLDNQYDAVLTRPAREYISQAIRSIHLEQLIVPSLQEYDFIIQDRGILSGYAYGTACGNDFSSLYAMTLNNVFSADPNTTIFPSMPEQIYDLVVYLRGDSLKNLKIAKQAKQEYAAGDAMESRGDSFITTASKNMDDLSSRFNTVTIEVDGKSIEQVHNEILATIGLEI